MAARARQNLRKRLRHVGLRNQYNPLRASYGPEWERLALRMGHAPFRDVDPERIMVKLRANSMYGKFAHKPDESDIEVNRDTLDPEAE